MSAFEQHLEDDLAMFLDPNEFGGMVMLDGVYVPALREDAQLAYPDGLLDDVRRRALLLHVRTRDIQSPVTIGRRITLDGVSWTIDAVAESYGMTTLTLSRAVS